MASRGLRMEEYRIYDKENQIIDRRKASGKCSHPWCKKDLRSDDVIFCPKHTDEFRHAQVKANVHLITPKWINDVRWAGRPKQKRRTNYCAECNRRCRLDDYLCARCRS